MAGEIARLRSCRLSRQALGDAAAHWVDRVTSAWLIRRFIDTDVTVPLAGRWVCARRNTGFRFLTVRRSRTSVSG